MFLPADREAYEAASAGVFRLTSRNWFEVLGDRPTDALLAGPQTDADGPRPAVRVVVKVRYAPFTKPVRMPRVRAESGS